MPATASLHPFLLLLRLRPLLRPNKSQHQSKMRVLARFCQTTGQAPFPYSGLPWINSRTSRSLYVVTGQPEQWRVYSKGVILTWGHHLR